MTLLVISIGIYLFNIPFGYWRSNTRKLSFQWLLSIHLPIPFIIVARLTTDIGFEWSSYIFTIGAFFLGQLTGKKIFKFRQSRSQLVSSCMVMDVARHYKLVR